MNIGELRKICDSLTEIYGENLEVSFVYPLPHATQRRTKLGHVTKFEVSVENGTHDHGYVRFILNHARGEEAKP
jgi:hypothetical protein